MKNPIPFMSVRGITVFPGNSISLDIGRAFSIASIKESIQNYDGTIVIASQRVLDMNDQPNIENIFNLGCVCKIIEHVEYPDGHMKIHVQPTERYKIQALQDVSGALFCLGASVSNFTDTNAISKEARESIASSLRRKFADTKSEKIEKLIYKVENIANPYEFSMTAGYLLGLSNASRKELTVEQLNQGVFQIDTYSKEEKATIDMGTARIQEILEARSPEAAVRKIEVLLEKTSKL